MRLTGFLSRGQVEQIHRTALRVLSEVGVEVQSIELLRRLEGAGGVVDSASSRARFAPGVVEAHIACAEKQPMADSYPRVSLSCGVYQSYYLDPLDGELHSFDEHKLALFFALAREMLPDGHLGMLGVPFVLDGTDARMNPLAEKVIAWKHGAVPGGSVHTTALCQPLLDMFGVHAQASGQALADVFRACGYLISPLKLAAPECEQLLFFADRNLRMYIGHLPIQGGTAPVTLAGAVALALAEQLFIYILNKAVHGDKALALSGSVSPIDMRHGVACYGRPEQQRTNLAFASIADFYGCSCGGHTGLTDAKLPSCEAGAQKAAGALMTAIATGHAGIEAGMLGMDEICSPIQMILDRDIAAALNAMLAGPLVDEAACAFDEIASVGIGGSYLGTHLTAERFRDELFSPCTWSGEFTASWASSGRKIDIDKARDIFSAFLASYVPKSFISDEEEREMWKTVRCALPRTR